MVRCTILTFKTMPLQYLGKKLPSFGIFHGVILKILLNGILMILKQYLPQICIRDVRCDFVKVENKQMYHNYDWH